MDDDVALHLLHRTVWTDGYGYPQATINHQAYNRQADLDQAEEITWLLFWMQCLGIVWQLFKILA